MNSRRLVTATVLLVVAVTLVCGCGGGGGGPASPPISGSARITSNSPLNGDGSYRWVTHFTARLNGTVEVQMLRGGSYPLNDPYLMVFEGNYGSSEFPPTSALVASDDDSGVGYNALTDFYASDGQVYTVWCTTHGAADYGTFRYTISDGYGPSAAAHEPSEAGKTPVSPDSKLK